MIRLRVLCPDGDDDLAGRVLRVLGEEPGAVHVVRMRGAAVVPPGDVVEADLARESVDEVLDALRGLGCADRGGIVLETLDTLVSAAADRAEEAAPGEGVDALVWDELLGRTGSQARLSVTFVVMLTIACLLGAIGVVTNSPVTVVGAMVLGPEFGPLAALAVAVVRRDGPLARIAALALGAGFAIALVVTALAAALADAVELIPDDTLTNLSGVEFVYQVGPFSLVIALLAGVAGMVALIAGEGSGVLVGVFISVTTVPAAGFAAVAAVLADWPRAASSLAQLLLNVAGIVLAGVIVLVIVRASRRRRGLTERVPTGRTGG
ncbi:putative hydrophobic protein (TIGR00271 family) [Actinomycetospora succinea]|uniref:Putative hydrophobic protein (TIGR00271 family) n=1 Tax=Actinomycetospora succinea TaxID=663603 RepID=A0A4R6UWV2_9PSEU|nr:DUF389 domain-containing protein [Actinomycetospora succinea]TDQ50025.1 putative hydrophobic protein (TIGR00271 family) [Actinomycetospora succinea]